MIIDFPVKIERKTLGVSERGFGTILVYDTQKEYEYKVVTSEDLHEYKGNEKLFGILNTLFAQRPQPQEVAIFGVGNGKVENLKQIQNKDFFFVTSTDNSQAFMEEMAQFVDSNNKIYGATITDDISYKQIVSNNTILVHTKEEKNYPAEALLVPLSYEIGGKTADGQNLESVKASEYDNTELKALADGNISTYIDKLGISQIHQGKMMGGEWFDVILGEYWLRFKMEEVLQQIKFANKKIPYTNQGIGLLVGGVESVLAAGVEQKIIAPNQYKIDYKTREECNSQEVASRDYSHIKWAATLSGAIQTGSIFGVLTNELVGGND